MRASKYPEFETALRHESEKRLAVWWLVPNANESEEPDYRKSQRREALQAWWASVSDVLRAYCTLVELDLPAPALPPALLKAVAGQLSYLGTGALPPAIREAVSEGRRRPGPEEMNDIALAVAYLVAASGGRFGSVTIKIDDSSPTKTICGMYGITPAAARQWRRAHFVQAQSLDIRDEADLRTKLDLASARYRSAGRSAKAVSLRSTKRRARSTNKA